MIIYINYLLRYKDALLYSYDYVGYNACNLPILNLSKVEKYFLNKSYKVGTKNILK